MLGYLIIIFVIYILFFSNKEQFTLEEEDFAHKVVDFIKSQVNNDKKGDFKSYLVFLDTLKNKNLNIEKLNTYYYFVELANDNSLKAKNILNKM
jgi:hypothetical protein